MIVRKREDKIDIGKGYLIISFHSRKEQNNMLNWLAVVFLICMLLYALLAFKGSFWGIRGFATISSIYLTYFSLVMAVNETQVWIQENKLLIKHKPLPWYEGNNKFEIVEIQKAVLKVRGDRRNPITPCVDVELNTGKVVELLIASSVDEAEEIAEEINRTLQEKRSGMLN